MAEHALAAGSFTIGPMIPDFTASTHNSEPTGHWIYQFYRLVASLRPKKVPPAGIEANREDIQCKEGIALEHFLA